MNVAASIPDRHETVAHLFGTSAELIDTLRQQRAAGTLTGSACRKLHRRLRTLPAEGEMLRIAFAGNVTAEPLVPYFEVFAAGQGFRCVSVVTPFAQHFQALDSDAVNSFDPDYIVLLLAPELLRPAAIARFAALDAEARIAERDDLLAEIAHWVDAALAKTRATLMIGTFAKPARAALGLADFTIGYDEASFYHDLNRGLMAIASLEPRVQLLDVCGAVARLGTERAFDRRMLHLAKLGWSEAMLAALGERFAASLVAASGTARKCVVVDLDNTLWGGVLGEDGPWGIHIGPGSAAGEAFMAFQCRLKALKSRGIALALCSKNNADEVVALFAERTDMPLAADDFAAQAVSWQPKDQGLIAIAEALNIGLDALVFLDDNPAEVALVKTALPQVEAVLLPPDPADFVDALDALACLEKSRLTREDRNKAAHYAARTLRDRSAAQAPDQAGYLADLGISVEIRTAGERDLPRLHQLFAKTNQFNVTTRRYSVAELAQKVASRCFRVEVMSMQDRYGDLGMIAAAIVADEAEHWRIDSLVMSCRAMGRGAETALLNRLKRLFASGPDSRPLRAEFRATARNAPVRDLFASQGFRTDHAEEDGSAFYVLTPAEAAAMPCDWLEVRELDGE